MRISSGFTPKGVEKKRGGKRMGNHSGNSDSIIRRGHEGACIGVRGSYGDRGMRLKD